MSNDLVLRVIGRLLIPFILLFALYVQFHGDFGPGGGFQAGVIIAAGMIFFALTHGVSTARKVVPDWAVETMLASGVLKILPLSHGSRRATPLHLIVKKDLMPLDEQVETLLQLFKTQ